MNIGQNIDLLTRIKAYLATEAASNVDMLSVASDDSGIYFATVTTSGAFTLADSLGLIGQPSYDSGGLRYTYYGGEWDGIPVNVTHLTELPELVEDGLW